VANEGEGERESTVDLHVFDGFDREHMVADTPPHGELSALQPLEKIDENIEIRQC
jgi:hypothetical protein